MLQSTPSLLPSMGSLPNEPMTIRTNTILLSVLFAAACCSACGGSEPEVTPEPTAEPDSVPKEGVAVDDHAHDEVSIGSAQIGEHKVELAQGHGVVQAGGEGHLVVKLPYSDAGATIVRAWLGGEDRTASYVGKGTYAPSHDDYDVHATAPDPLPTPCMWWVELELPGGKRLLGSAKPIF